MDPVQVALLVLVAVVVGMLIPLVFQLYSLAHSARQIVEKSSKDVEAALKGVHHAAERIDRLTEKLERDGRMDTIVDGLTSAAQVANQMKATFQTAATVAAAAAPAVAAAVHAFRAGMEDHAPRRDGAGAEDSPSKEGKEAAR
jgi:predicted PurR-regulated permease PerM